MDHISSVLKKVVSERSFTPENAGLITVEEAKALSPSEMLTWVKAMREAINNPKHSSSQGFEKTYKCHYCLDLNWISIKPIWAALPGSIEEATEEDIFDCLNNIGIKTIRVACDCHRGHFYGNDTDPKEIKPLPIKKFAEIVGEPVSYRFGKWIVDLRNKLQANKGEEIKINEAFKQEYF